MIPVPCPHLVASRFYDRFDLSLPCDICSFSLLSLEHIGQLVANFHVLMTVLLISSSGHLDQIFMSRISLKIECRANGV